MNSPVWSFLERTNEALAEKGRLNWCPLRPEIFWKYFVRRQPNVRVLNKSDCIVFISDFWKYLSIKKILEMLPKKSIYIYVYLIMLYYVMFKNNINYYFFNIRWYWCLCLCLQILLYIYAYFWKLKPDTLNY